METATTAPDWTAVLGAKSALWTAIGTGVLAIGVIFAALQFWWQRKASQVLEAGRLQELWREEDRWDLQSDFDKYANHEMNRQRANSLYRYFHKRRNRRRRKEWGEWYDAIYNYIEDTAALAERMEIYIRRGAADETIIMQYLGYDILSSYYILQDILQLRTDREDLNYQAYLHLAQRVQDNAKVNYRIMDIRDELVWADFPPLRFNDGQFTDPHPVPLLRRLRLKFAKPPATMSWD